MEERTYRLNGTRTKSVAVAVLGSLFGLFILDMFLFEPIPNGTLLINMIIVVLLSVGIGVLVYFLHKDRFLKLCEDGIDHISGKNVTHYSFEDFLGTNVVKHSIYGIFTATYNYYNGIYTGPSRYIKFHVPGSENKSVQINCSALKADQFDEMIAYLSKNEFEQAEKTEAVESYFETEKLFEIPKQTIIMKNKSAALTVNAIIIIAAILLEILFIVIFKESILTLIIICLVTALVAGAVIALRIKSFNKFRNQVPEKITLDNYTLAVDGRTFPTERTIKVVMTPPSYDTKDRVLLITTNDKSVASYNFARLKKTDEAMSYPDYPSLYNNIKLWCLQRNISFMASLN